jgi:hypothetical protein
MIVAEGLGRDEELFFMTSGMGKSGKSTIDQIVKKDTILRLNSGFPGTPVI